MKYISLIICFLVHFQSLLFGAQKEKVISPDGQLMFSFSLDEDGKMFYDVQYGEKEIIQESRLGVEGWNIGLILSTVDRTEVDSEWKPVFGERSLVKDRYRQINIHLLQNNNPRAEMQLQVRAYNEGIAFRYAFPENPDGGRYINIRKEFTEFTLPEETKAWFTPRAQSRYKLLPLSNWPGECERPLVLQLKNGLYACLAEAEMVDYSRTKFVINQEKENTIACSMFGPVELTTPFHTPWRVIMVADKPGQLLENNDLILNLNPPNEIANTSWLKPGKVMREVTLSAKGARELVDFAVEHNLQYIHFDAGWYGYEYVVESDATTVTVDPRRNADSDLDLHEAIRYADENGIGVILYVNQRALYKQLDELLPLYKKWGVRGVKFGFVHVGSHRWTTWMHEAVRKCAEYNLVVDIHDEYRPTGFSRTYPNLMTQEGILGNEGFEDATHNTILPFTRFVAGAADNTICYYRQDFGESSRDENGVPRGKFIRTTAAHQLAISAIFYSPLQYMYWYDKPSDAQDEPELEFFDAVKTVWDDTKVVHGEIGAFITVARRSGEEWFVGTITNNDARKMTIPLDFLPAGKMFEARIYSDDPTVSTRTKVGIQSVRVDSKSVLNAKLLPSGGQAIWIKPLR
jgi:alpha-glucosidase